MKSLMSSVRGRDAAKSRQTGTESVSNGRDRGSYAAPWARHRRGPPLGGDGHEVVQDIALQTPSATPAIKQTRRAARWTDHHTGTISTDTSLTGSGGLDGATKVADLYPTEAGR